MNTLKGEIMNIIEAHMFRVETLIKWEAMDKDTRPSFGQLLRDEFKLLTGFDGPDEMHAARDARLRANKTL